ncbi:MAG TPA: tRNA pseudouridine(13) synthase TruD, partial [Minicystis sp.]|nr:tRNA pseudouridine(13) synthase TruD [Minicystis sp.]
MTDLPVAVMKERPGDFVVEELPAYAPSGRGEHLFVTFRKTDRTTLDVLRDMARALGVDARGAGFAGMKDRNAVTTQTVSFPFPIARAVAEAEARLALPGVEVLSVARHDHKLKPGHLAGNRFTVTLRGLAPEAVPGVRAALEAAGREGVPNAFGPQRFGRDGDNPARALAWLAGREKGPRDRATQRLLVSALQSLLYNRVLAGREAEGTFRRVLPGDVAKKTDTGGLFVVPPDGPDAEDAARRGDAGLLHPTGPMFGAKMRWPEGR